MSGQEPRPWQADGSRWSLELLDLAGHTRDDGEGVHDEDGEVVASLWPWRSGWWFYLTHRVTGMQWYDRVQKRHSWYCRGNERTRLPAKTGSLPVRWESVGDWETGSLGWKVLSFFFFIYNLVSYVELRFFFGWSKYLTSAYALSRAQSIYHAT